MKASHNYVYLFARLSLCILTEHYTLALGHILHNVGSSYRFFLLEDGTGLQKCFQQVDYVSVKSLCVF